MTMDTNQVEGQMVVQVKVFKQSYKRSTMLIMWKVQSHRYSYHWFDINFERFTSTNNSTAIHKSTNNNTQMQAMLPSPSTPSNDAWFFDTRATHRLTQEVSSLINVQPYKGKGQVIVGNGKQILILNIGTKSIPFTL